MEKLQSESCQKPIVFVIDIINGFVKEGALADPRINSIVPNLIQLMDGMNCRNVFVCDSHPPHTREFDAFAPHCLIGTKEAEVIDELQPYIKRIMKKNSTNAFHCQDFLSFLEEEMDSYRDIIVTGCCTDLCVLQFVLTLQAWLNEHNKKEYRIIVPKNCVETYDIPNVHSAKEWNELSFKMMQMNGILVVDSIDF